jgi:High potential iron-sulfur protein
MANEIRSRRALLASTLSVGGSILFAPLLVRSASSAVCYDPSSGDPALRKSLNYTEVFSDTTMTCGDCAFFSGDRNACGVCAIFSGPVNGKGHCDSWSHAP